MTNGKPQTDSAQTTTVQTLVPDWSLPPGVQACVTTRETGASQGVWTAGNLADHVGDVPQRVQANRRALQRQLGEAVSPVWLAQTHSTRCVRLQRPLPSQPPNQPPNQPPQADASWTDETGVACAVLTADCVPILLVDEAAMLVAAIHAGWRGLVDGVIAETLAQLPVAPGALRAWIGPAIGPAHFEVGPEVVARFEQSLGDVAALCRPGRAGETSGYWADLPGLVKIALQQAGVQDITLSGLCTYADSERFYSYRRDGQTGRQASLIWLTPG